MVLITFSLCLELRFLHARQPLLSLSQALVPEISIFLMVTPTDFSPFDYAPSQRHYYYIGLYTSLLLAFEIEDATHTLLLCASLRLLLAACANAETGRLPPKLFIKIIPVTAHEHFIFYTTMNAIFQ